MIIRALLALLLPISTGLLLICRLWPWRKPTGSAFFFRLCLSVGVGFGIFSCTFYVWLLIFGAATRAFWAAQVAIAILLAASLIRRRKLAGGAAAGEKADPAPRGFKVAPILLAAFIVALIAAAASFTFMTLRWPHGEWDAWAAHNMRARFLFRAGDEWRAAFSSAFAWSSTDYPLLIPATIAGCWTLIGQDTVVIPSLVALLFTVATAGLLSSSLSLLRSQSQGRLAGLVLLGTPQFIMHGATQYLDIPLGFFLLSTLGLLSLQDRLADHRKGLLLLAGMSAGFAAWTKNEGLLFVVVLFAARLVCVATRGGARAYVKQMRLFTAGLAPILLVIIYHKVRFGAANAFLSPQGRSTLNLLLDGSRHRTILTAFKNQILGVGDWTVSLVGVLMLYLLFFGWSGERKNANTVAALAAVAMMLMGYYCIFLITPFDLNWQLDTTLNRLVLQLWPSFLFVFFLFVRTPEEVRAGAKAGGSQYQGDTGG